MRVWCGCVHRREEGGHPQRPMEELDKERAVALHACISTREAGVGSPMPCALMVILPLTSGRPNGVFPAPYPPHTDVLAAESVTQLVSSRWVVQGPFIEGAESTMLPLPARQKQQHDP